MLAPRLISRTRAAAPAPAQEQSTGSRAFITTAQTDYKPGDAVVIFGTGWLPNEVVTLTIHEASGAHADTLLTATADEYGNLLTMDFAPKTEHLGATFHLTATGQTSGRTAEAKFTDGGIMTTIRRADSTSTTWARRACRGWPARGSCALTSATA
jgi:hypothetical protein